MDNFSHPHNEEKISITSRTENKKLRFGSPQSGEPCDADHEAGAVCWPLNNRLKTVKNK